MNKIGHMQAIEMARRLTKNTSEVKDWRLRTVADKRYRDAARELSKGKGYIIATVAKIREKYPEHITIFAEQCDDHKYLWAFTKTIPDRNRRVGVRVCAIHQF